MLLIYTAFSSISEHVKQETMEKQMIKTAEFIRNVIVKAYTYGNYTNSSLLFTIEIPDNILGYEYAINVMNDKLHISTTSNNMEKNVSLYNMEVIGKKIYSNAGLLKINYTGNKITLS